MAVTRDPASSSEEDVIARPSLKDVDPRSDWNFSAPGSFASSLFLMTTAAFGTGVLTLPFALKQGGLAFGTCVFLYAGLQSAFANYYLLRIGHYFKCDAYGDLLERISSSLLSRKSVMGDQTSSSSKTPAVVMRIISIFFDFWMALYIMLAVVTYLVFLTDFCSQLLILCGADTYMESSFGFEITRTQIIMLLGVLVYPMCLVGKLSALRFASSGSLAALCFVVVVVLAKAVMLLMGNLEIEGSTKPKANMDANAIKHGRYFDGLRELDPLGPADIPTGVNTFAVAVFANVNQVCTVPLGSEFRGVASEARCVKLSAWTATVIFVLYSVTAVAVCYQFGNATNGDFLTNYALNDFWIVICRAVLVPMLLVSIVLNMFPCLQGIFRVANGVVSLCKFVAADADGDSNAYSAGAGNALEGGLKADALTQKLLDGSAKMLDGAVLESGNAPSSPDGGIKSGRTTEVSQMDGDEVIEAKPKDTNAITMENYPTARYVVATLTLFACCCIATQVTNVADFVSMCSSLFSSVLSMALPGALVLAVPSNLRAELPLNKVGPALLLGGTVIMWANTLRPILGL